MQCSLLVACRTWKVFATSMLVWPIYSHMSAHLCVQICMSSFVHSVYPTQSQECGVLARTLTLGLQDQRKASVQSGRTMRKPSEWGCLWSRSCWCGQRRSLDSSHPQSCEILVLSQGLPILLTTTHTPCSRSCSHTLPLHLQLSPLNSLLGFFSTQHRACPSGV